MHRQAQAGRRRHALMQACNSRQGPVDRQKQAGTGRQECRQAEQAGTGVKALAGCHKNKGRHRQAGKGSQAQ